MEKADPKLVIRAHPALCTWPLLSWPSRQPRWEGRRPAALVVFTVVGKVLVFVIVVGVFFCFIVVFCFFFFLVWLVCFLREGKKKVCNYFLQSSHYISVNNKEEIL